MATGDGNGWVSCRCGHRHWGRHGAAGLLLLRPAAMDGAPEVLLQLRAEWTHQGGTWGLPGGAIDSHESPTQGALREAHEEAGVRPAAVDVLRSWVSADHGDWTYTVVIGRALGHVEARPGNAESTAMRWVRHGDVADLSLHPGFAHSWPALSQLVAALHPAPPLR